MKIEILVNSTILLFLGFYQGDGFKIGFGQCTGTIIPALPLPK